MTAPTHTMSVCGMSGMMSIQTDGSSVCDQVDHERNRKPQPAHTRRVRAGTHNVSSRSGSRGMAWNRHCSRSASKLQGGAATGALSPVFCDNFCVGHGTRWVKDAGKIGKIDESGSSDKSKCISSTRRNSTMRPFAEHRRRSGRFLIVDRA